MKSKYLPSRNFLIALSIAVVIIIAALIFTYAKNKSSEQVVVNTLVAEPSATSTWQTDVLENSTTITPNFAYQAQYQAEFDTLNSTQKLARNLISDVIAVQPSQGSIDQNTTDALVQKTIDSIPVKNFSGKTTEANLNITAIDPNTIKAGVTAYINGYYTQTENFRKIIGLDLSVINTFLNATDTPQKTRMIPIISAYQNIINNLIAMPLPTLPGSPAVKNHLAIINDIEKLIQIDNDIMNSNKDIANIYGDLDAYNTVMNDLIVKLKTLDLAFKITRR